jgi:hypothetical protein
VISFQHGVFGYQPSFNKHTFLSTVASIKNGESVVDSCVHVDMIWNLTNEVQMFRLAPRTSLTESSWFPGSTPSVLTRVGRQIWSHRQLEKHFLLALTTVKEVMVSMNAGWWDWAGQVPAGRVKVGMSEWTSKSKGR